MILCRCNLFVSDVLWRCPHPYNLFPLSGYTSKRRIPWSEISCYVLKGQRMISARIWSWVAWNSLRFTAITLKLQRIPPAGMKKIAVHGQCWNQLTNDWQQRTNTQGLLWRCRNCSVSTGSERLKRWWNDWSRRQNTEWGPKSVLPLFLPKEGRRQFFFVDAFAAVAAEALPPPSRSQSCMTSDHFPYNIGNVATPQLYGPPWWVYLIAAQGGGYG